MRASKNSSQASVRRTLAGGQDRSEANWLVGTDTSKALSMIDNDDMYLFARVQVQTATLASICKTFKDHQISNRGNIGKSILDTAKNLDFTIQFNEECKEPTKDWNFQPTRSCGLSSH